VSLQGYTAAQLATEPVQEFLREGPLTGGTDVDNQLLEAAKTGDLDLVKVCSRSPLPPSTVCVVSLKGRGLLALVN